MCLFVCFLLFTYLCIYAYLLFVCLLFVCLLFVCLFVCLLFVYLFVYLFVCLFTCLFVGEIIHSMIAHQDAVTGLDIDSQGLFVLTSGNILILELHTIIQLSYYS